MIPEPEKGCGGGGPTEDDHSGAGIATPFPLLVRFSADTMRCHEIRSIWMPDGRYRISGIRCLIFLRKEVIQPQVPLRLPCYDFTPVADLTVAGCFLAVSAPSSGKANSHGVTGGVYKARERIHRGVLIRDY